MADALKKTKTSAKVPRVTTTPHRPRAERDRLNFRIDARIKARAEDAAQILGQDLSTFAESALDEKAQAVIAHEEKLILSDQDFEKFVAALDKAPAPTPALVAARRTLGQLREAHPEGNW